MSGITISVVVIGSVFEKEVVVTGSVVGGKVVIIVFSVVVGVTVVVGTAVVVSVSVVVILLVGEVVVTFEQPINNSIIAITPIYLAFIIYFPLFYFLCFVYYSTLVILNTYYRCINVNSWFKIKNPLFLGQRKVDYA
jgi:hypothetical protein